MLHKATLLLMIFLPLLFSYSKAEEGRTELLVDTDMGLDDTRALALLVNLENFRIAALVTSDGSSSPSAGAKSIARIMQFLGKERPPVGIGRELHAPAWREKSETMGWAKWPDQPINPESKRTAKETILETLTKAEKPMTYVCMGPLTNLAESIQENNFPFEKIDRLLYYGSSPDDSQSKWNTRRDLEAAKKVFASPIKIWLFNPAPSHMIPFDASLYSQISKLQSKSAQLIQITHRAPEVQQLFHTSHSIVWDEMLVLYLHTPSAVWGEHQDRKNPRFNFRQWDRKQARKMYIDILADQ